MKKFDENIWQLEIERILREEWKKDIWDYDNEENRKEYLHKYQLEIADGWEREIREFEYEQKNT